MVFKQIKDKESYLKKNYPFATVPNLKDTFFCVHCEKCFEVSKYKVVVENGKEYIVCPDAPECDGSVLDFIIDK